jgi:hypothetical protein
MRNRSRGLASLFGACSARKSSQPELYLKTLHTKIGELALELDLLSPALDKAGHPSDRR